VVLDTIGATEAIEANINVVVAADEADEVNEAIAADLAGVAIPLGIFSQLQHSFCVH
jgi:hypothetical protein